ncbi:hypothetical protein [Alicyclobacillus sp. SP_1]|uniref:hypothetical protein n=1 Tax=Alicyclobacillus sp. SP_1 TaxID=2942475 RepID=UPI002158098D|nr:hypothetical protein [Alicyclobacillus sp. SP_1]
MFVVKSEKGCIEDNDVVSFFRWNQDTLLGCSRVQTIASVIADAFFCLHESLLLVVELKKMSWVAGMQSVLEIVIICVQYIVSRSLVKTACGRNA